ncbi:MAG: hypothetical protein ACRDPW_04415 [Mycobacteriales bacterium]
MFSRRTACPVCAYFLRKHADRRTCGRCGKIVRWATSRP